MPVPAKRKRGAQPGNQNARRKQPLNTKAIKAILGSDPTLLARAAIAHAVAIPAQISPEPGIRVAGAARAAAGPTYIDLSRQLRRAHYASMLAGIHEFTELTQILGSPFRQLPAHRSAQSQPKDIQSHHHLCQRHRPIHRSDHPPHLPGPHPRQMRR